MGYNTDTRRLTLTATLAAVYVVFRAIPIDQLIGINGTITAAGMIAPIIGILLEPAYGIVAVFTGTMVASLFPWNPIKFAGLDFLPGALNVTLVSLAVRGRRLEATLMFLITMALFIINPYTSIFVGSSILSPPIPYLWMHLVALLVLVSPLTRNLAARITSHQYSNLIMPVAVLAFVGTMIEHLTGGILFATVVGKGAVKFWPVIFLVYPIERIILVIGATLIGGALLSLLRPTVVENSLENVKRVQKSPIGSVSQSRDSYACVGFRREPDFLARRAPEAEGFEILDIPLLDRRASSFTSSENLSAPDAKEANASPAVLAAAVPNAAASFRLEAKAAIAICSPALIASSEAARCLLVNGSRFESFFLEVRVGDERDVLGKAYEFGYSRLYLRWESARFFG